MILIKVESLVFIKMIRLQVKNSNQLPNHEFIKKFKC